MAKNSGIAWTDDTANFWWGCQKVDQGCAHCYAETLSKRVGKDIWGPPATTEREIKKAIWRDLPKWDKEAGATGIRRKVFVQSMSDFLEDHPALVEPRKRAVALLESLTNIDVLLLTKRPENALRFLPGWMMSWPRHVWFGTSIAEQKDTERLRPFRVVPAEIRWLSVEPMIGPVDFELRGIRWVICGGESGAGCRPMNIEWARDLMAGCVAANVPFFMKQLGGHPDPRHDPAAWPEDLRMREFPREAE